MNQNLKLDKNNIVNISELTPLQEGMLFHHLSWSKGNIYFVQLSLEIEGSVDVDIFKEAWQFVVESNELLRTIFRWEGLSKPLQIVLKNTKVDFTYNDLSDKQNPQTEIETIKRKDYEKSFNLLDVPFRLTLCKCNKDEYLLLISNHHIIYDGWSNGIILKEFIHFYNDLIEKNKPIVKVKTPYKQFILLNKQVESEGLLFWKNYLNNYEKNSFFKFKHLSNEIDNTELTTFLIPIEKTELIKKRCEQLKITISDLLYNAWGILLSKYSRVEDVVFGTTVSGRNVKLGGIEDMVGLFINTIPLRLNLPYEKSLVNLICENSNKIRERDSFENIPLHNILENSKYKNDELFESIFVVENYPLDEKFLKDGNGLKIKSFFINETTNYKLTVCAIISNEIVLHFKYYNSDLDSYVVENIGKHFIKIIESIISNNESTIQSLDILSEEEKHQVLHEFNKTKKEYPKDKNIISLFEKQVEKYKENIVIKQGNKTLSYLELQRKAEQVSALLRSHGVVRGDVVAIEQYRSIDMIISIFGILQAGCAYLPIDPNYPVDRKNYIINDSESRFLLTSSEIENSYGNHITKIFIDSLPPSIENLEQYKIDVEQNSPCYIIYTSGSTGRPKGVQVCHSSVINLLYYLQDFYPVKPNDSYLFKTSYCFDVSVSEIFGWMLGGGHLTILENGAEKDADRIAKSIHDAKVSHVNFVPSMFKAFSDSLSSESKEKLQSLKYVIIAGEALHYEHIKSFVQLGLSTKIENLYGPTEATVYASMYSIDPKDVNSSISIGKGISNTNLYILDKFNLVQAIGMAGELCIGGECLAIGYINNPELTHDKFIEHPFKANERLYRTGDLARWLPDGNIEFLGRIDHQVKIRGFRIELGEIECALLKHELIKEAVVIAKGETADQSLYAYYVSDKEIDIADIKDYLSGQLPDYMVPTYFIPLDCIPLTPNGKVDRRGLPTPEFQDVENFEAPQSVIEEKLRKIWSEILHVDENSISINSSFFVLGGHSLSAIRLLNLVKKEFSINLTIDEIFSQKTIKKISECIQSRVKTAYSSIPLIAQKPFYDLSPAQKRLYFLHQLDRSTPAYNLPLIVKLDGKLNVSKLTRVFEKLITRHESLRTSFQLREDRPVQVIFDKVTFNLELFKSSDLEVYTIINGFIRSFDLSQPPLLRVGIIEINQDEHILMIDMHHIITDGVSLGILTKEFMALYNDEVLPEIRIQYKDYSAWQQSDDQKKEITKQKEFWINEFAEEITALEIPSDFARPIKKSYEGNSVDFEIGEEEAQKLKTIAKKEGVTMFMVVLSIFNILLSKLSNQEDIVIGTPIAGRQHSDLEDIVGMFVNTLPLRNYPKGELNFSNFLSSVSSRVLKCFDNQDYPYEELIDVLKIERDTSRNPLFDVMFAYQNFQESELKIPGLILKPIKTGHAVSKFDITLTAFESDSKIKLNIEYSTQLFKRTTIDRFIIYFKKIVSAIAFDSNKRIADIEVITEGEKHQILVDFNNTKTNYPEYKTINSIFEEIVVANKDLDSIVFDGKPLTYFELNEKSNQIARVILKRGVNQESIIGVMMPRSHEMIASILGILKAGCAYVPVDPEYPLERISYIIENSGLNLILVGSESESLCNKTGKKIETINVWSNEIKTEEKGNVDLKFPSTNLAYIIFTSGSTGNPKGIMIEHKSVVNFIYGVTNRINFKNRKSILCLTTVSFDIFVLETLLPLLSGMRIVMTSSADQKNPNAIAKIIDEQEVDVLQITPSHLKILLSDEGFRHSIRKIKILMVGGEAFPTKLLEELKEIYSGELYNMYGPTETTVWSTIQNLTGKSTLNIGTPIANTSIRILNKHKQLLPVGVPGELCIGGSGVARGYWRNDQLTNEKFIVDPILGDGLIFQTGDLAKWLPDGSIEYLGRLDNQVKVRGFRIELGEVETQIGTHDQIQEVVVCVKSRDTEKYLVAYYVSESEIDLSALREFLVVKLPEYMIPSYFVRLPNIPLTPNGKINRKALPEPDIKAGVEYVAPSTEEEKILSKIWAEVLGIEDIGVAENFFTSGGDSIKSIMICSKLRNAGYEVSVSDIFSNPIIKKLASKLRKITPASSQQSVVGKVATTPFQQWILNGLSEVNHCNGQSAILNFPEEISEDVIQTILRKIYNHHDALRMVFREGNEVIIEENKDVEFPISLETYDLKFEVKPELKFVEIRDKFQVELSLKDGILAKLGLFQTKDGSRLLITIHPLIVDRISWQILLEDIETLYQNIKKGESLILPTKTDSFQLWSTHIDESTKSNSDIEFKTHWNSRINKKSSSVQRDKLNELEDIQVESFSLSKEDTVKLTSSVHNPFKTQIDDILITALLICLNKKYNINSLEVFLEGCGRKKFHEEVNVSRTIGCFTEIYPLILGAKNELSETIQYVKEALRTSNSSIDNNDFIKGNLYPSISFATFNWMNLGVTNFSFDLSGDFWSSEILINGVMPFDWTMSGTVVKDQLSVNLAYNYKDYKKDEICDLMASFKENLTEVIDYCCRYGKVKLTPSDISCKLLSIEQLNALQGKYELQNIYPLSPMQEGMLFHSLLKNESDYYFEQIQYRLSGELDLSAFENSISEIAERHDILRTIFLHEGYSRPLQLVLKEKRIDFSFKNIQNECLAGSKETVIESYRVEEKSRTFDLLNGALMRLTILQTAEAEYLFIWSFHHIIMDGWCIGILISEINNLYLKNKGKKNISLPPVKPYSSYIEWLEKRNKSESLNYWRNYLSSYENLATIPCREHLSSEKLSHQLGSQNLTINKEKTKRLQILSGEYGVSINTIIQSVWAVLLAKYNNTDDVVFGSVVSGRPGEIEGIEKMVGLFINTVPVRVTLGEKHAFNELLCEFQKNFLDGEPNHYNSLPEIQTLSELERGLFNHIIVFENYPISEQINNSKIGFTISDIQSFERNNYDLMLLVIPGEEIHLRIDYSSDKYESDTISKVFVHFNNILEQVTSKSTVQISDIELVSESEEQQLLNALNFININYPKDKTVHELFVIQASKTPSSIAIKFNNQSVTYAELNERSDRLAHALRSNGVKPNDVVGLMMDRSVDTVIGMISILKAGGAYLPIDVTYPKDRKDYLISDSGTAIILTTKDQKGNYYDNITTLFVEDLEQASGKPQPITSVNKPSDLCYVIYTSGTTGNPKGVMVEHRNVVRLFFNEKFQFDFGAEDVWTMFHSHCFDFSVWEIYGALLFGGKLIIIPKLVAMDTLAYLKILREEKVTILNQTPSAFYNLSHEELLNPTKDLTFRYIIFGGEALSPGKLEKWKLRYPETRLINMFGITETTVHVTYKEIGDYEIANNISNVGKPIPTLSLYIFDKNQKLLPNGIIGEIYVGGAGVARGYLGKKELTDTKFVINPYDSSERLYRSGDLGRVLHSGDIEYLGRIDHQVQLRGFRVELGEIESRLISHDKISEAVVIAKEKETDKYLIAYYVSAEEISVHEMRNFLSAKLPDYMIPSYFIRMDGFPLTSNGKLDRKVLPDPLIKIGDDFVASSNEVEERLVEIWAEILKLDKGLISVNKSFFDLGGHSLKVILLANEILAAFKVRISISDIFTCDTIAQMAKFIIDNKEINYELVLKSEIKEYYKLSAAQQRIYFQQKLNPQTISYNIIGVFKIEGKLNVEKIENSFNTLVDRNESLRTVFLERDGQVVQKILDDVSVKIEHVNSSELTINEDIQKLSTPFELDKFPLFRLVLAKINNECHYLLINIHHIISDGVSVHLMFRDFISIYEEEELSEPPFQYKDFSEWQNNYFTTPDYEKEKYFWLNKFKPQPPTLKIPLDFERPKIRNVDKGDLLTFSISGDKLNQLNLQVKSMNGTLFMYLFSIYNIFLHKISGMEDLTIGVLTNGRYNKAFQGVLGMFVNTLPFRNKINTTDTFVELFNLIKHNSIKYLSNQNFQLDELILAMGLQGKTEDSPLFNHLFNINMDNNMQVELSDLKVSNVMMENHFAKFDLHLVADVLINNIQMKLRYSTELFKKSTIENYINYYNEILDQVLSNENIKIEDIQISHNVAMLKSEINTDAIFQFE